MGFAKDIKRWTKQTDQKIEDVIVSTIIQLNTMVVEITPVKEGRARGSWVATLNNPSNSSPIGVDKSGKRTINKSKTIARKAVGKVYYLVSNLSYIPTLEYGLYPNPPKEGSYNKELPKGKKYQPLSEGGYSKQAPHGMVMISVKNFKHMIKKAVKDGSKF